MSTRQKGDLWVISGLLCLVLLLLLACTPGTTPPPTSKPTPSPTSQATTAFTPTPKSPTTSTTAPVSFAGKTITIVTTVSAGGGNDIMSRVYTKYLPKFLPGNPTMIVRNMVGAAGSIGANYAYLSKPDGLTILNGAGGHFLNQLLGVKAVRYDVLKMPLIIFTSTGFIFFIKSGIISKPEDLLKAKGIVWGSSAGAYAYVFLAIKELLNFPTEKVVLAYPSTVEARRAFLGGELNMSSADPGVYKESLAPLVAKGEIMPLFVTGLLDAKGDIVKDPAFPPGIPTPKEFYEKIYGKSPSGIEWEAYKGVIAASKAYDRTLLLPPGTPDNIVRVYWDAAEKMLKDPEFRRMADLLAGEDAQWIAGEASDKQFKANLGMKPEVSEWIRSTLIKYGMVIE